MALWTNSPVALCASGPKIRSPVCPSGPPTGGVPCLQVAIDRQILMGPDWVARAAAGAVNDPRARWMLRQSRDVRRSYALEVHGKPDEDRLAERWMLLQPDHVRPSYVEHVLDKPGARPRRPNRAA